MKEAPACSHQSADGAYACSRPHLPVLFTDLCEKAWKEVYVEVLTKQETDPESGAVWWNALWGRISQIFSVGMCGGHIWLLSPLLCHFLSVRALEFFLLSSDDRQICVMKCSCSLTSACLEQNQSAAKHAETCRSVSVTPDDPHLDSNQTSHTACRSVKSSLMLLLLHMYDFCSIYLSFLSQRIAPRDTKAHKKKQMQMPLWILRLLLLHSIVHAAGATYSFLFVIFHVSSFGHHQLCDNWHMSIMEEATTVLTWWKHTSVFPWYSKQAGHHVQKSKCYCQLF